MVTTHIPGFPRIGARRQLKFALESYWAGKSSAQDLLATARELRQQHWRQQAGLDFVTVGDFSLYDQVLDMSFTLGNVPARVSRAGGSELDRYFRAARGRAPGDSDQSAVAAGEMTKWFDTNYHFIVPEFERSTRFKVNPTRLLTQVVEAQALGLRPKPVIIGPVTYLWLGKSRDGSRPLDLLPQLLPVYLELLDELHKAGVEWVQIDEPVLATELAETWKSALRQAYTIMQKRQVKLLMASYFGPLADNLELAIELPVDGLHVDASQLRQPVENRNGSNLRKRNQESPARDELSELADRLPAERVLSAGVINGRNIWKTDLNALLDRLQPLYARLQERLWLAPSCSLLHVPVDLATEKNLPDPVGNWLSFAVQKVAEVQVLANALVNGVVAEQPALQDNAAALASRRSSQLTQNPRVRSAMAAITPAMSERQHAYPVRSRLQRNRLPLPAFPTTTIGSFPQTSEIREARRKFRQGSLSEPDYQQFIRQEIRYCIRQQEQLGLDVLVHGEAERNDMVEYFSEHLTGFVRSQAGWVQSYGSRCVKPPILYGDVSRPAAITVDWISYARSLTDKPVKGMLTGPVTILNWSFVRDDQPRADTCRQLALAIRAEVLDLEQADVGIIQIDEAALREGLPLRKSEWQSYLDWAIDCFRLTANGVSDTTQIHTHMCYSQFNDILPAIAAMDADVITIETSRSNMELLDAFNAFAYPNEIGPGVYDIHSPNIPVEQQVIDLMQEAARRIPADRLWINPDCGLKTRSWPEVLPALRNMVAAANTLRSLENRDPATG